MTHIICLTVCLRLFTSINTIRRLGHYFLARDDHIPRARQRRKLFCSDSCSVLLLVVLVALACSTIGHSDLKQNNLQLCDRCELLRSVLSLTNADINVRSRHLCALLSLYIREQTLCDQLAISTTYVSVNWQASSPMARAATCTCNFRYSHACRQSRISWRPARSSPA